MLKCILNNQMQVYYRKYTYQKNIRVLSIPRGLIVSIV
jgi:hypothetical protein